MGMAAKTDSYRNLNAVVKKNVVAGYLIKGGSIVVGLLIIPAYMRFFANNEILGIWFAIQSLIAWMLTFDFGIMNGLRNRLSELFTTCDYDEAGKTIASSYRFFAVFCLFTAGVICFTGLCMPWTDIFQVSSNLSYPLSLCVTIVLVGMVFQLFLQLIHAVLYALQLSAVVSGLSLGSNALMLVFIAFFPSFGDASNLVILAIANFVSMTMPLLIASLVVFGKVLPFKVDFRYFDWSITRHIFSTGMIIFYLQVTWMIVSLTHPFLIAVIVGPENVVEYQVYYRVFNGIAALATVAMAPVWSASTKAKTEKNYRWIDKSLIMCILLALGTVIACLLVMPLMQPIFNIWLGTETIQVRYDCLIVMCVYAGVFVLHVGSTSVGNGLGLFRVQIILMSIAALAMIPFSFIFCHVTGGWIGVIIAMLLAIAPFEIIQPIYCLHWLKTHEN